MAEHTHRFDLAGVCTGPGPCDTSSFGAGKNWVNKVGGLPDYIRAIAHSLQREHGMTESRAISTAVATVKRWAAGGGGVTAATRARAAAALAEWESKKAASHALTATPAATVDLAFTESLHPRNKGKFAPKGAATTSGTTAATPAGMTANVKDFQRRMGLPVTGVIDAATRAAISRATAAKGGGGKKKTRKSAKKAAAHARAVQRRTIGQHVATVNSMSVAQRNELRRQMPVPPTGYVWGAQNTLRRVKLTRAQEAAPLTGI